MVAGEIFIHYTDERFPFLLGRKGTFDREGRIFIGDLKMASFFGEQPGFSRVNAHLLNT